MKLLLLALLSVVVFISVEAVSYYDLVQEQWDEFKATHQKKYDDATEEKFRMKIYMENVHTIAKHNQLYAEGLVSFQMKANKYADMLPFEFVATRNGFNRNDDQLNRTGVTFLPAANVKVPDQIDWRDLGAVTPIKDQGNCGSCWSFSATGSLEGQNFRKTGQLVSLSEQNLMDCSTEYGNNGCSGGLMDYAFEYVISNHGIDTETSYPYEANDDSCRYDPANIGATATNFVDLPTGEESQLQNAVATVGPISVAIDANHVSFQFYSGGIYYEPECNPQQLDHGVLVIGYGTDSQGEYWLVKNSWGTSWGASGYIKMSRNRGNNCGIATLASYPLV